MSSAIEDILEACQARPQSAALHGALLDAVSRPAPAIVTAFFDNLDPSGHEERHRRRVADFLSEAGMKAAAEKWKPRPIQPCSNVASTNVVSLFGNAAAQTQALVPERSQLRFIDVSGLENVKQQIRRRIIAPIEKPQLFEVFRKRAGGGVLMYGPPGCGKTMLARATAGEVKARFFQVAITDVVDKWRGEQERKLAAIFEQARAQAPAVLFFDEIEAFTSRHTNADACSSLVSTFLSEMDGIRTPQEGLLVLAATNTPWAVDAAFRRPGRFDHTLFVPPPDLASRKTILDSLLRDRPVATGLDPMFVAESTSGFSGADLSGLIDLAVDLAIEESSGSQIVPIARRHLEEARAYARPTTMEWLSTARNYSKYANEGGLYDEVKAFLKTHGR
jgi:transitional endoplasmic reticulum ATPase